MFIMIVTNDYGATLYRAEYEEEVTKAMMISAADMHGATQVIVLKHDVGWTQLPNHVSGVLSAHLSLVKIQRVQVDEDEPRTIPPLPHETYMCCVCRRSTTGCRRFLFLEDDKLIATCHEDCYVKVPGGMIGDTKRFDDQTHRTHGAHGVSDRRQELQQLARDIGSDVQSTMDALTQALRERKESGKG